MSITDNENVKDLEKAYCAPVEVKTIEDLEFVIARAKKAQKIYSSFTQEQVDAIFRAASLAANNARIPLAKMAVEETRMASLKTKSSKTTLHQNIFIINTETSNMRFD
jgi:acetaldehyde dehydrogenase/alcohol dehydrogenase